MAQTQPDERKGAQVVTRHECDRTARILLVKGERRFEMLDRLAEIAKMELGRSNQVMNDTRSRSLEAAVQQPGGQIEAGGGFGPHQMVVEQSAQRPKRLDRLIG